MPSFIILLFDAAFLLLLGLAAFVVRKNSTSWLNRYFALAALSLFAWLFTLFIFNQQTDPVTLILVGRLNYASVLFVALLGYLFVREVMQRPADNVRLLLGETVFLAFLTVATPLVDQSELIQGGEHITRFGPLFVLYILHIVAYLSIAVILAFHTARHASRLLRNQLAIIGLGMLVTTVISVYTDLILPYVYHVFAWQTLGALSTLIFLGTIAYAITVEHLFNVRLVIRATLVSGALIAIALEVFQAAIEALTHLLPLGDHAERYVTAATIALIINALANEPLRKALERLADRLMSVRFSRSLPPKRP